MARPGIRYLLKDHQSWNFKPTCVGISYTAGGKKIYVDPEAWSIQTDQCSLVIWHDQKIWTYDYFGRIHSRLVVISDPTRVYINGYGIHQMTGYESYLPEITAWFQKHVPELIMDG